MDKKKTAIVTGGSSGIGLAVAEKLLDSGINVAILSRDEERGRAAENELKKHGDGICWIQTDLTVENDVRHAVDKAMNTFGNLNFAFNNGGSGATGKPLHQLSIDEWRAAIDGYLTSAWLSMKYELPAMMGNNDGGVIINNASAAGLRSFPGNISYAAAKHGLIGLSTTAAAEYADHKIRVNVICPGWIETPPIRYAMQKNPEFRDMVHTQPLLKRAGQPEEVADLAGWLFSEEAAYITGAVLPIDGGYLLR